MDDLKSGIWTTEHALTLLTTIGSLLVALGIISPKDNADLQAVWIEAIKGTAAMVVAGVVSYKYIHSRTSLKQSAMNNDNGGSGTPPPDKGAPLLSMKSATRAGFFVLATMMLGNGMLV